MLYRDSSQLILHYFSTFYLIPKDLVNLLTRGMEEMESQMEPLLPPDLTDCRPVLPPSEPLDWLVGMQEGAVPIDLNPLGVIT